MSSLRARSLKDILTFTRATAATYCDVDGVLTTAEVDEPRIEYDPETLVARGLLIEEARTNLLTYSNLDPAHWSENGSPAISSGFAAPDGSTEAIEIVAGASNDGVYVNPTVADATVYTFSVFLRHVSGNATVLIGCDTNPTTATVVVNVSTRAIASVGAGITASSAQKYPGGWVRASGTFTSTGTASAMLIYAQGAGTFQAWGAQFEAGAFPTSYIPTVASTVARARDVCETSTINPWFAEDEGTFFVEYLLHRGVDADSRRVLEAISDAIADSRYIVAMTNDDDTTAGITADGAAVDVYPATGTWASGTAKRNALAWGDASYCAIGTGYALQSAAVAELPTQVDRMFIGASINAGDELCGYIRKVKFYPRRLSDNELRALVA